MDPFDSLLKSEGQGGGGSEAQGSNQTTTASEDPFGFLNDVVVPSPSLPALTPTSPTTAQGSFAAFPDQETPSQDLATQEIAAQSQPDPPKIVLQDFSSAFEVKPAEVKGHEEDPYAAFSDLQKTETTEVEAAFAEDLGNVVVAAPELSFHVAEEKQEEVTNLDEAESFQPMVAASAEGPQEEDFPQDLDDIGEEKKVG